MADTIQAPMRDPTEVKIFILYLMEHIGRPLDYIEVNDIVVQNGVVKSFDFCTEFPDLIRSGHILITETDGKELYSVTTLGREVLEELENKLLNSTKTRALENAVALLNRNKTHTGYRYGTEAHSDGTFGFHVTFTKDEKDVLSVSATVPTARDAENMEVTFEQPPELFRRALTALLTNQSAAIRSYDPFELL